ncbi:class I SAM-dependent methyltransferase [Tabrizicola sp.]|uniref:class I SAM-dependent methyltransferase n=1 Tax=Tabrizicola sp. TaxID=2005166 RepID=UPI0027365D45|nr:class I SAM-dependent methyltransferase [Tabrizicola sp.]MDP3196654.1 class I SAM-dependent methyltransferase [Tabrizicola sp.]
MQPLDRSDQYQDQTGFIDVKKLIAAYSFDEHVQRADDYFKSIENPWVHQLRKPFHEFQDSRATLAGFAAVLDVAKLRAGHRVVDFGCGTGWLSMALALMRCTPIGLDVSQEALNIARSAVDEHPLLRTLDIAFDVIGETMIGLEDASVDRIICFDSFHHVSDQATYLKEFHRILKPGGLAVFHEPGPRHSASKASQEEMANFAVIENDIVIEDIAQIAQAIGFQDLRLAAFTDTPILLDMKTYLRGVERRGGLGFYHQMGKALMAQGYEKRVFVMRKAGETDADSRFPERLGAKVTVKAHNFDPASRVLSAEVSVKNTGNGLWLASGAAAGAVNLAATVVQADGTQRSEAARFPIAPTDTPAGMEQLVKVALEIPAAYGEAFIVELDLVSELITWFSEQGLSPTLIHQVP